MINNYWTKNTIFFVKRGMKKKKKTYPLCFKSEIISSSSVNKKLFDYEGRVKKINKMQFRKRLQDFRFIS